MPAATGSNFGLTYGYSLLDSWNINDDFRRLDALLGLTVESAALTAPPGSPATGARYIIAATATGAWAGKETQVARYTGTAWEYFIPPKGLLAYDLNGLQVLRYTGSAWSIPTLRKIQTDLHNGASYDNDAAAAAGGVALGEIYRNDSFLLSRRGTAGLSLTGPLTLTGAITAPNVVVNGTAVPANGMNLPASNTLGWAVDSAVEVQLTSTALSPAVNAGNALGTTTLGWNGAHFATGTEINFANGNAKIAHSSGLLTVTGALTTTGAVTAPNVVVNGTAVPANGMYLPSANTLGLSINSAAAVRLTATALSPAVSGGSALGTTALPWGGVQIAANGSLVFGNDVTVAHTTDTLTLSGGKVLEFLSSSTSGAPAGVLVKTSSDNGMGPVLRVQGRRNDGNATAAYSGQILLESVRTDALPASGKTLGSLVFGGNPDLVGGVGYPASIAAVASGTWVDASTAPTDLVFRTGSEATTFTTNVYYGTDRGRVTSGGRWLLGSSTDDGVTTAQVNGTLKATGTVTAPNVVVNGTAVPINGMNLPASNTLGWAVDSAVEVQLTSTALSPAVNAGNALGTTTLGWNGAHFATGTEINFANGNAKIAHSSGLLTVTGALTTTGAVTAPTSIIGGGTTTPSTIAGGSLYIRSADGSASGPVVDAWAATPQVVLRRANGTAASPTTVASGNVIADLQMRGYDGSTYTAAHAAIQGVAAETWSGAARGTHIDFNTTKIGSANTAASRMRLSANGNLLIGSTTDDGVNALQITGSAKATTFESVGVVTTGAYFLSPVAADLTAVGTNRGTALQLTAEDNFVSTAASGTGVILPTSAVGRRVFLSNDGANAIKVYAVGSDTVDDASATTGVTLSAGAAAVFRVSKANTWRSRLSGGASA